MKVKKNIKYRIVSYTSNHYGVMIYKNRAKVPLSTHIFETYEQRQRFVSNIISKAVNILGGV